MNGEWLLDRQCSRRLRFGDKFYRQTSGIAMGNRVAPPLAIIFMNSLERQYNTTAVNTPDLYMRYIDDVLGVWTSGPENLRDYLHHINSTHPSISFTIETTEDSGSIPFLDTKITVEPNGKYTTELYIKPTSSGIILHADSAQPWKTKRAVLHSQTRRAIRLSSDEDARARSIQRIRELFSSNGYNDKINGRTIATCTTRTRHDPARHDPTNRTRTRFKKPTTRTILPFIDDKLTTTVEAVIRGSDLPELGVTWTNDCTIKSQLVRSALKPPACPGGARCHACIAGLSGRCHTSGVVYQLTCTLCNKIYIGESGRMTSLQWTLTRRQKQQTGQPLGWSLRARASKSSTWPLHHHG